MTNWIALFGAVATTCLSGYAAMKAWMNGHEIKKSIQTTEQTAQMTAQNAKAIEQVHVIVNDRLTKLLETTGALARSEGMAAGRHDEKVEEAERDRLAKE